MSDHYNSFIVILEHDIKDDEAKPIIEAIKQLRGVLNVEPHIAGFEDAIAQSRVRTEFGRKLLTIIYPDVYGKEQA